MNTYLSVPAQDHKDFAPLLARHEQAKARRSTWEDTWQVCYDYALPHSADFTKMTQAGRIRTDRLYDATALDCVDQLAASMLGHLTPPWTQWFGFKPGPDLSVAEAQALAPILEDSAKIIQSHFDRSNFSVEMHQCFLDLVVGGTAALYLEEAEPGSFSAFKFSAVPLADIVLEEGENGFLDGSYRTIKLTLAQIKDRYPQADIPSDIIRQADKDPQARFSILESILPRNGAYDYTVLLTENSPASELVSGRFSSSPCIAFRWMKSPGEMYGRSPVMKALPDIKTANKVVELILKNASIAVTGIWQADDDGVLNPANIELVPGAIIPKAVGSQGLKPLEMPGRFDVSQIILDDLRARIRHALLVDKLGQLSDRKMTATEVMERSGEMALLLGATYGRLQTELLTPMIRRAYSILRRRGEIPDIALDGRFVVLDYRAPIARAQAQKNVQTIMTWIGALQNLGAGASSAVNAHRAAVFLGEALGVPSDIINKEEVENVPAKNQS